VGDQKRDPRQCLEGKTLKQLLELFGERRVKPETIVIASFLGYQTVNEQLSKAEYHELLYFMNRFFDCLAKGDPESVRELQEVFGISFAIMVKKPFSHTWLRSNTLIEFFWNKPSPSADLDAHNHFLLFLELGGPPANLERCLVHVLPADY
jgi:hypothetical protein